MRWTVIALVAATLVCPPSFANALPAAGSLAGTWHGQIDIAGQVLKIAAHLVAAEGASGFTSGTIDIPTQGAKGLVLDGIAVSGDSVRFRFRDVGGNPTFMGRLAGDVIAGSFTQAGMEGTFTLSRGELERASRPQDPKPPFPYHASEVHVESRNGVTLAGTLTVPDSGSRGVGAVLVTGSGAENRDEELFDHRPFWVIADALSRAGITVLRCDDRGVGGSTGSFAVATTRDFADDAQACVTYLRRLPGIRSVGIIGHSEGGLIAQILCARDSSVAWAVTLGGPAVSGREVNVEQVRQLMLLAGASEESAAAAARDAAGVDSLIEHGAGIGPIRDGIRRAAIGQGLRDSTAIERLVTQQSRAAVSPWFREFLGYDPRPNLRKIRVPFLAYYGGRDFQVPPTQNEGPAREALRSNPAARVVVWPGLNHMFQHATAGGMGEYMTIEETISPDVLAAIVEWVGARGKR